jgi:hypothetical protein
VRRTVEERTGSTCSRDRDDRHGFRDFCDSVRLSVNSEHPQHFSNFHPSPSPTLQASPTASSSYRTHRT